MSVLELLETKTLSRMDDVGKANVVTSFILTSGMVIKVVEVHDCLMSIMKLPRPVRNIGQWIAVNAGHAGPGRAETVQK